MLNPASCAAWHGALQEGSKFLSLAKGSDCLVNIRSGIYLANAIYGALLLLP